VRAPESIAGIYFLYSAILAWTLRLPAPRRWLVTAAAAAAGGLILAVPALPAAWRAWAPAVYLLVAYKASGLFFTGPMPRIERTLAEVDRRLFDACGLARFANDAPRLVLECLEAAYLLAPPLVPLALFVVLRAGGADAADRFWTLVLPVEFVCFGMLPWIQTRPPWLLEPPGPMDARSLVMRRANRLVVGWALMPVNTFPSGHAATSLALALATLPLAPLAGAGFLLAAAGVAAGSILGRYHYALDAAAGVAVSLCVWSTLRIWER
jgi:hypothetical protein